MKGYGKKHMAKPMGGTYDYSGKPATMTKEGSRKGPPRIIPGGTGGTNSGVVGGGKKY